MKQEDPAVSSGFATVSSEQTPVCPGETIQLDPGYRPPSSAAGGLQIPGYEFGREIGRGGMGVVYAARQVQAHREVAVKMMLGWTQADSRALSRFEKEAEVLARLQSPHIITVFEVGQHEGCPFFSMEYCSRGSLADLPRGARPSREAAELMCKIARGVAIAHIAGIVHRDLKPGNVLIAADGTPKVSDFGLAKQLDSAAIEDGNMTRTGAILGTPHYMAPEQVQGAKHVGPPADVFSLGAMLYELLTGRTPFRGDSTADTLMQVLKEDPVPVRELSPEVPRDLDAICRKCLEKDPQRRYANAAALAADLSRFLDGEAVEANQSGIVMRLASTLERVQLHERFAEYGNLLLALAPLMLIPEILITFVVLNNAASLWLPAIQFTRLGLFVLLYGYFRNWRWLPQTGPEKQLWTVWVAYVAICFCTGLRTRFVGGPEPNFDLMMELEFMPTLITLAAMAFFALAPTFWGYCAVIGVAFLAISWIMCLDIRWAAIEFGLAWAVTLVVIGVRLRRLSRLKADSVVSEG